jgi:hypothetical protein
MIRDFADLERPAPQTADVAAQIFLVARAPIWLVKLLNGSGMRLSQELGLRVQDIGFQMKRTVFPARDLSRDLCSGVTRQPHRHEVTIPRGIKAVVTRRTFGLSGARRRMSKHKLERHPGIRYRPLVRLAIVRIILQLLAATRTVAPKALAESTGQPR